MGTTTTASTPPPRSSASRPLGKPRHATAAHQASPPGPPPASAAATPGPAPGPGSHKIAPANPARPRGCWPGAGSRSEPGSVASTGSLTPGTTRSPRTKQPARSRLRYHGAEWPRVQLEPANRLRLQAGGQTGQGKTSGRDSERGLGGRYERLGIPQQGIGVTQSCRAGQARSGGIAPPCAAVGNKAKPTPTPPPRSPAKESWIAPAMPTRRRVPTAPGPGGTTPGQHPAEHASALRRPPRTPGSPSWSNTCALAARLRRLSERVTFDGTHLRFDFAVMCPADAFPMRRRCRAPSARRRHCPGGRRWHATSGGFRPVGRPG